MKKLFLTKLFLLTFIALNAQIEMNSSGNVGIGIAPYSSFKFYVNGNTKFISSVGIGVNPISSYKLYVNGSSYFNSLVGIGTVPNSSYKLDVDGQVNIESGNHGYSFVFNNSGYYGQIGLQPSANNNGWIGTSSKAFSEMYAYNIYTISDSRQKENLKDIKNPLNLIKKLKGYKYDIKKKYAVNTDSITDPIIKEKLEKSRFNNLGFLAQELSKTLPEAVKYDEVNDIYAVDYSRIIPVLVEALKEQQTIIDDISKKLKKLETNETLKNAGMDTETNEVSTESVLRQNVPNPFTESTTIEYELSENAQQAMLNIYDMNGTQLKSIALHHIGTGSVTINSYELKAGMYMYALVANGQIIDTKRMILTD